MPLTDTQIERYSRQIILPEVGGIGQEKLLAARVLVVGAGGLGATAAVYLAAAGVGTLGIVDDDRVELANLQRQVLYSMATVGRGKAESARSALALLNPDCAVRAHAQRLDATSAADLIAPYEIVVDAADNFATKFLLNDTCVAQEKPLVSGSVLRFDGQLSTFLGFQPGAPCYRCLFPAPPPPGLYPTDEECGIFGVVAGLIGALQATEVLKLILGVGSPLVGRMLIYDALGPGFREVTIRAAPDCTTCVSHDPLRRAAVG